MLQEVRAAGINQTIVTAGGYGVAHTTRSYHVDAATDAALAIHQLSTFFGSHSGTKTNFTNPLTIADFMWIMHDLLQSINIPASMHIYQHRSVGLISGGINSFYHNSMRSAGQYAGSTAEPFQRRVKDSSRSRRRTPVL